MVAGPKGLIVAINDSAQPSRTNPPRAPGGDHLRVIRLFVAMPSDLTRERRYVGRVVAELNAYHGQAEQHGLILKLLTWEDVVPDMGRPQDVIFEQMQVKTWDLFIGALWKRFGSASGGRDPQTGQPYNSGTEEEFRAAHSALRETGRPRMMFYHRTRGPQLLSAIDTDQLNLVNAFIEEFKAGGRHQGLYVTYGAPAEFERRLRQDLTRLLPELATPVVTSPPASAATPPLSQPHHDRGLNRMWQSNRLDTPFQHGNADYEDDVAFLLAGAFYAHHSLYRELMNNLGQSYLVYGHPGCGRTAWARWFADADDPRLQKYARVLLANGSTMADVCAQVTRKLFALTCQQPRRLGNLGDDALGQLVDLLLTYAGGRPALLAAIEGARRGASQDADGLLSRLADALRGAPDVSRPGAREWELPDETYRHVAAMSVTLGYERGVMLILDTPPGQEAWLRRLVLDQVPAWGRVAGPTCRLIFVPFAMYDGLRGGQYGLLHRQLIWSGQQLEQMAITRYSTFVEKTGRRPPQGIPWQSGWALRDRFEPNDLLDKLIAAGKRRESSLAGDEARDDYDPRRFMSLWRSVVGDRTYWETVTEADVARVIGRRTESTVTSTGS